MFQLQGMLKTKLVAISAYRFILFRDYRNYLTSMARVSPWTQVLSTNGQVTTSFIPLAIKIQEQIYLLGSSAIKLFRVADRSLINELAESLSNQFDDYFPEQ